MNLLLLFVGTFFINQVCCAFDAHGGQNHDQPQNCNIYNVYKPEIFNVNYNFNNQYHHDHTNTPTDCHCHTTTPTSPMCPERSLVSRSENTVSRSENYIQMPCSLRSFSAITRGPSAIIGAPVGITDVTTLTMETDLHVTNTIEFSGVTAINGGGNILYLDAGGALQIDSGSTLAIKNVTLRGVGGSNIFCVDNTSSMTVQNVTWVQSSDFTFAQGSLDVMNTFNCIGNGLSFNYTTSQVCTIHSGATMSLGYNYIFNYSPSSGLNNLFTFADQTSTLYLSGGSLFANSTANLALQKGIVFVEGLVSLNGSFSLGDGINPANDTICVFGTGSILDLVSGSLTYNNLSASSWSMLDVNAILKINPSTTFDVFQNLNLGAGTLLISTSATLTYPIGVNITGSVSFF